MRYIDPEVAQQLLEKAKSLHAELADLEESANWTQLRQTLRERGVDTYDALHAQHDIRRQLDRARSNSARVMQHTEVLLDIVKALP